MDGEIDNTHSNLVYIGYTYNTKKVLCFTVNRRSGSTEAGMIHEAMLHNKYNNVCIYHVSRSYCISNYFIQNRKYVCKN